MPISPTPPRGTKTRSSSSPAIELSLFTAGHAFRMRGCRREEDVAGLDQGGHAALLEHQATLGIEVDESSGLLAAGAADHDGLADSPGACQPVAADGREALALRPEGEPARHL